jgi:class 3 adenylate cyclase
VARELGRRLVLSADAIGLLVGAEPYPLQDLGARLLRGRASPVQVYAAVTGPARGC